MIGDTVQTSVGEGVVVAVDKETVCVRMKSSNMEEGFLELFPKTAIIKLHSASPFSNNIHIRAGKVNSTIAVKQGADSVDIRGVMSVDIHHLAHDIPHLILKIAGYPNIDHYRHEED